MKNKIYSFLCKTYGYTMTVAFFGGVIPLVPFIIAIIIGGKTGEAIAIFLKNRYYPVVIALASIAVIIGLIAMYIDGRQGLSVKVINSECPSETSREEE